MTHRSLTSRRWVTPLLAAVSIVSATGAWHAIGRLADERDRLATLRAATARPANADVPRSAMFRAADRNGAAADFITRLKAAAESHRLLVEEIRPLSVEADRRAILSAGVMISGSEDDIRQFARSIESGDPAIRFVRWQIAPADAGEATLRLDATAAALWAGR